MRPILATLLVTATLGLSAAAGAGDAVNGPPPAQAAGPAPALVLPPSVTDGFVTSGARKTAVQSPLAAATPRQRPAKPDEAAGRRPGDGFWPNIRLHGSFGFGH
jgi:hypothetical protein